MDKVNQKMRRFNLRGVLIGLRASVGNSPQKVDVGVEETLRSEHFQVAKVYHSFTAVSLLYFASVAHVGVLLIVFDVK